MSGLVYELKGDQRAAAVPIDNVWLSASAGTGKTQVLSARVLRLLLQPEVEPGQILCLTFTKAGAAEMANRINAVLARWVRLSATDLAKELGHLGADIGPDTQARARSLFASVLDCPGGGLRIDTIHAFSQWLLANFPEEAGLIPGTRAMEDRERVLLAREVLADVLERGDARLTEAVQRFTRAKEPGALLGWLMTCADAEELWEGPAGWQSPVDNRVRRLIGIPADADEAWANEGLAPGVFPDDTLRALLPALQNWTAQIGQASSAFVAAWLTMGPGERVAASDEFYNTLLIKTGAPRKMATPAKAIRAKSPKPSPKSKRAARCWRWLITSPTPSPSGAPLRWRGARPRRVKGCSISPT
jgi:ATP-dependent helicase/nuclease subunit A